MAVEAEGRRSRVVQFSLSLKAWGWGVGVGRGVSPALGPKA